MTQTQPEKSVIRLDKWLWAARFYKTRAIAKDMIRLRQGNDDKEVFVIQLSGHRQSANVAQTLYEETPESISKRIINAEARRLNILNNPAPDHKPDKKQRRQIMRFKDY